MRRYLFSTVLYTFLQLTSLIPQLLAQESLEGPQVVPTTKLVVLKAPEAPNPDNYIIIWQPSIKLDAIKRGNEYIFVAPKSSQTMVISAIAISIVDGKLDVKEFEHNLLVVSPEPDPDPDPKPDPTPDPSLTDFQKVVKASTTLFPPDECRKVAACYARIAKAIENGKIAVPPPGTEVISNPVLAFSTFKACCQSSLGPRWEVWRPAFDKITESANKQGMQNIYDVARLMRQAENVLAKD